MLRLLRDLYDPYEYSSPSFPWDDVLNPPTRHFHVIRPARQTSLTRSPSQNDPNQFQLMLNVNQFRPEEIDVKMVDDFVVVHGKHEEHADEHGYVSREFTRRYQLPDDVDPSTVKSSLSQNGILSIRAPRKNVEPPPKNERVVPITIQQPRAVEEAQKQQLQEQQAAKQQGSEVPME